MENVIVYLDVADKGKVDTQFSPKLSIYVFPTNDVDTTYKPGQRLTAAPPSKYLSWQKDLRLLDSTTTDVTFDIEYDPVSQKYIVTPNDTTLKEMSMAHCPCGCNLLPYVSPRRKKTCYMLTDTCTYSRAAL